MHGKHYISNYKYHDHAELCDMGGLQLLLTESVLT